MSDAAAPGGARLRRELGIGGAILLGLGSMIGTGVFVSIGIAAGVAGPAVIPAIALAAVVAACNALSSAQLAANHAVSGGTYEYGYRYLSPALGFSAGWLFLIAKSASAATAALGFAAYALRLARADLGWMAPLAVLAVVLFTLLVLAGLRRSNWANAGIVATTLAALAALIVFGMPMAAANADANLVPLLPQFQDDAGKAFFYATALMFVAFTGYGRLATLGEEVIEPRRTIPRAIIATMLVTALLYVLVAVVVVGSVGAGRFVQDDAAATPLELAARAISGGWLATPVAVGATTAMLGVLLNLIIGLSRVALAMGRQGDLPPALARLSRDGSSPPVAVIAVGVAVALLAALGSIETAWAFSAFTVLLYYAITNLAALRLPRAQRLYPAWVAVCGLVGCLFLAFWVPIAVWAAGLGLVALGLAWHVVARRLWSAGSAGST